MVGKRVFVAESGAHGVHEPQAPAGTAKVVKRPAPQFSPRRGRPTAGQAAAISRSILHAAAELFLSKGFEATSMEAIAEAANVPRSTLYKRFPSKLSLLHAVTRDRVAHWEAMGARRYAPMSNDLEARLKQHAEQVLYWANSDDVRAFMRLASGTWEGATEIRQILNAVGYNAMVVFLESEIRTFGQADGAKVKNARAVADTLMAMLTGWLSARQNDAGVSPKEAQAFAHAAVDLLLYGRAAW
jgi:AcrR family transcriptional regulator